MIGALTASANLQIILIVPNRKDIIGWGELLGDTASPLAKLLACLPAFNCWGANRYVARKPERFERVKGLTKLSQPGSSLIITTVAGLSQRTLSPTAFCQASLRIGKGCQVDLEAMIQRFNELGYQECYTVHESGTYAVRGGIIDIFSAGESNPSRIELIGDRIRSIRTFSTETQASLAKIEAITLVAAKEHVVTKEDHSRLRQRVYEYLIAENVGRIEIDQILETIWTPKPSLGAQALSPILYDDFNTAWDFLDPKRCLVVFPRGHEICLEHYKDYLEEATELYKSHRNQGQASVSVERVCLPHAKIARKLNNLPIFTMASPFSHAQAIPIHVDSLNWRPELASQSVQSFWAAIEELREHGYSIVVLCKFVDHIRRINDLLILKNINNVKVYEESFDEIEEPWLAGHYILAQGSLQSSLIDRQAMTLFVPDNKILGVRRIAKETSHAKLKKLLSSLRELAVNDLVVHIDHGIGLYKGLKQITIKGSDEEFLEIEYRGGDRVYLPVARLGLVQKYKKSEKGKVPQLDRLGAEGFARRKVKASYSIEDVAKEIIELQAKRKLSRGISFGDPGEIYQEFVDDFPFPETSDQLRCIDEIEADMRKTHPMERLLVGDVGFGKTEVALRAIVRCILNGRQALYLVPTTVLCYQQFGHFEQRLKKFGVKLAQLHRFVSKSEQLASLEGFGNGSVDLIVGTHRLLSASVNAKALGLVVIDEEQKFGVMQKERLKNRWPGADMLLLSATPIPRTLHLAMAGITDLSIIVSPPKNRLPIKTVVAVFDAKLIRLAVDAEIKRGGQVFFVHNRASELDAVAEKLREIAPGVKLRVAHGQMRGAGLEKIIIDFLNQEFQVLVCTTIIESGVDMPNVNTLIVNQAHNFGLSQLYQIRGRVGRSAVQGYAYFLLPQQKLGSDAIKRLDVLQSYQELGSGFSVASHDLELRGSGSIAGKEQSGHIAGLGLELYVNMLEAKIRSLKAKPEHHTVETEIKIRIEALIPKSYIPQEGERLRYYKRLFSLDYVSEADEVCRAIVDSYGEVPKATINLVAIAKLKAVLSQLYISEISEPKEDCFELKFSQFLDARLFDSSFAKLNKLELVMGNKKQRMLRLQLPATVRKIAKYEKIDLLIELFRPLVEAAERG